MTRGPLPGSTIVVAGALANKPLNGGEAWVRLSWVRGFQKLGYHVHLLEQIHASSCVDAEGRPTPFATSANLAYFREVVQRFDLAGDATLVCGEGEQLHGASWRELSALCDDADLLVNISGNLRLESLLRRFRRTVYVDIDPGFTQFWHVDPEVRFRVADHDFYYTIGENVGEPGCTVPMNGIRWRHTRQPVVLEDWPVSATAADGRFTTLANWRGPFGAVAFGGRSYGLKVHEFRKFIELPSRARATFELALNISAADGRDRNSLEAHGWRIVDPRSASGDPDAFRRYVQDSPAEFSVAQGIYVDTRSGWFSDRTVRYLASGKPVLVQDTGFGRTLPVGEGLLGFRTLEEAVTGAEEIQRNYPHHARRAREIAEAYFDSNEVLGRLLDEVTG